MLLCISSLFVAASYNQPKFSPCASWNATGSTFASRNMIGNTIIGIFVNINNSVYVASYTGNNILVWLEGNANPTRNISGNLYESSSIFATTNGDIYVDNGNSHHRVDKWALNATSSEAVMDVADTCHGLFIDLNNTIYCSMADGNKVVKKSLDDNGTSTSVVAGTGTAGNGSNQLNQPRRIFIDAQLSLYVADQINNRIQKFTSGQPNATTVAGVGSSGNITLYGPKGVVLDADDYLFIVDSNNNRIVGEGPNGFRCLVGCSGSSGSTSYELNLPRSLYFDSYGNMFVADTDNNRIQKFHLAKNSCGEFTSS